MKKINLIFKFYKFFTLFMILISVTFYFKQHNLNYYKGSNAIRINTSSEKTLTKIKYIDKIKAKIIERNRPIKNKKDLIKIGVLDKKQLREVSSNFVTTRTEKQLSRQLKGEKNQ